MYLVLTLARQGEITTLSVQPDRRDLIYSEDRRNVYDIIVRR